MFGESQFDSCRQMRTKVPIESTAPFGPDIFTVRPHSSVIGNRKVIVNRKSVRPHSSCVLFTTLTDETDLDGELDNQEVSNHGNPAKLVNTPINSVHGNQSIYSGLPANGVRSGSAGTCRDGSASKARRLRLNRLRLKRDKKINHTQQHTGQQQNRKLAHKRNVLYEGMVADANDATIDDVLVSETESDLSDCSLDASNRELYHDDRRPTNANEYFDDPGFDINDPSFDTDLDVKVIYPESDFSSFRVYKDSCGHYGIIPATYFLRNLNSSKLNMRHYGLGAKAVKPIAITLVSNPCITKLDLTDNWLCNEGGIYISDMLKENIHITEINLSENNLGSQFTQELQFAMQRNTSITRLILRGNNFEDVSAIHISSIIQSTNKLQCLDLSCNQLTCKSGQLLGSSLCNNTTIKVLMLAWNSISCGVESIFEALSVNMCLEDIDVSHNGITSKSMKSLSDSLKINDTIVDIDLSYNRINDDGLFNLTNGLKVNESLSSLKLTKNTMTSQGCSALIAAVQHNEASMLQYIDFGDTFVDNNFLATLVELRQQRPDTDIRYHGDDRNIRKQQHHGGHPMQKLRKFIERKNMKLVDFFNKLDSDGSMSISRKEFLNGIQVLEIPLTDTEKLRLLNHLDKDGDGEIDYSELAQSHEEEE